MTLKPIDEKINICQFVIDECKKKGADDIIVYFEDSQTTSTSVSRLNVEDVSYENNLGISVRIIKDYRCLTFNSANLREDTLIKLIDRSISAISHLPKNEHLKVMPAIKVHTDNLNIYDEYIHKLNIEERSKFLINIEKNGLNIDTLIKTDICKLIDSFQETLLMTSKGFCDSYKETDFTLLYSAITSGDEIGTEQYLYDSTRFFKDLNRDNIELIAAKRAIELRSNETIPSQKIDLFIEPRLAMDFIEYIEDALDGPSINKKISFLADKIGEFIGNEKLTLIDDGTVSSKTGTLPFDAEGLPVKKKAIIENGEIKIALHDVLSAGEMQVEPTGNAIQTSYLRTHGISSFNLVLESGEISPKDVLSDIKKGIYLYSFSDTGGVDTISGNFSVEAKGIYIENGKLSSPLNHLTLASTLPEMIKNMEFCSDSTWFDDSCMPSIRIKDVIVSCE